MFRSHCKSIVPVGRALLAALGLLCSGPFHGLVHAADAGPERTQDGRADIHDGNCDHLSDAPGHGGDCVQCKTGRSHGELPASSARRPAIDPVRVAPVLMDGSRMIPRTRCGSIGARAPPAAA